ncbi:UNVERIFIED_CONTAM: Retrovirus-related Pol polyprotein from transposon [Sesamum indicum]
MERHSKENMPDMETPVETREPMIQMTRAELQQMIEEASRNAVELAKKGTVPMYHAPSEVGSSSRDRSRQRGPAISRAEVDNVSKQIATLGKQIDELKKRGEIVSHNQNSPFCNKILTETVNPSFRMPDLPKYDGTKDPQEHLAAFDMVMNLYGQPNPIIAKLFATTLTGKAQECKRKQRRSATHLFTIRQKENETLKSFMGCFNNEMLEVQDLRIDMMISILIHGLKKGVFASALARDPPADVEQLMAMAQKYIDEEEMNAMKDEEWRYNADRGQVREQRGREKEPRARVERAREPPYQPKYSQYTPLNMTRARALMMVEKDDVLQWPKHTRLTPVKKHSNKYCRFHREKGHDTEECYQLRDEIERLLRQGYFKADREAQVEKGSGGNAEMIKVGETMRLRMRKRFEREYKSNKRAQLISINTEQEIVFGDRDVGERAGADNDPMVIKMDIANFTVHKVLVDNESSADIIFREVLRKMDLDSVRLEPVKMPLVGFGGAEVESLGAIDLPVSIGEEPKKKTLMVKFLVIDTPFTCNVILGRPGLNSFRAVVSTYHLKMKFPTQHGIGEVLCDQVETKRCYNLSLKKGEVTEKRRREDSSKMERPKLMERIEPMDHKEIEPMQEGHGKRTRIGSKLGEFENVMITFLRKNVDMFAWEPTDLKGIDPGVIMHRLNVDPTVQPVQQKKRAFGVEKNCIIEEEVNKLLKAGYISEVQYTNWLANVVMVPKTAGKWRMCTDFTDLNKACPKDPYPLPRIDLLVDSTAGHEIFSIMDAYQGYHQIFMATEDCEKTSFVTDKGIFCYNVMPFGLKNAGATYQRLVNKMFANLIGKTMEIYVDDMLVKNQKAKDHLKHLEAAFAIMRRYGMKLNPNKCTFRVGGGKFLGYMISERGIEANPEKIEAILNLKSPSSVKEVQKLTGRISSLNRFISKSADRNLHFFKILRKAKRFEWTSDCDLAFQK